jgi:hypothetical protein
VASGAVNPNCAYRPCASLVKRVHRIRLPGPSYAVGVVIELVRGVVGHTDQCAASSHDGGQASRTPVAARCDRLKA